MESTQLPFHPLANIFPLMEGQAFRDLVEDVRVNGLRESIVLLDGAILDGRNRARACHAAQVGARYRTYDGKDAVAFVVSANLHRRHLDASQRAMIAAEIANLRQGAGRPKKEGRRDRGGKLLPALKCPDRKPHDGPSRQPGTYVAGNAHQVTADKAGALLSVSAQSIRQAQQVIRSGVPELVSAVKAGAVTVVPASEIAKFPKTQQAAILRAGPDKVRHLGNSARRERLTERRTSRAATAESDVAVYDHIKVGDGRAIGSVLIGEIDRLTDSLMLVIDILRAVQRHGRAGHDMKVRDVVSKDMFAKMIATARSKRESA